MALAAASTWGGNIATAINALAISDGAPITPAQLAQVWTLVKTEDTTQLAQADVAPKSFTAPSGGGAVTGIGGPVT